MNKCWNLLFTAIAVLAIWPTPSFAQHYGFGLRKQTVTLERRLVPNVRLGNVSVAVLFPRGSGGIDENLFSSYLETLVAQSGGGIRLVSQAPEYEIRCYTTGFQPPHIVAKTEAPAKFLGTVGQPVTTKEAHGNVTLDAHLVRASDGAAVVAFTESAYLNASTSGGSNTFALRIPGLSRAQSQGQTAASSSDPLVDSDSDASLNGRMLKTLALRVASHMVPMDEQVPVLLAQGGPLDEAARLAVNRRWSEYLEKLSTVPTPPDPADNAYLLYDLGVANEALGYAASDAKATLKYLQESSIDYSRAAAAKPSERYFIDPQKRIETAITRYTSLAEHEGAPPPASPAPERRERTGERLTNADVVKLVKAHLDKGLIANKIATVPLVDFDLSVDGMVALSQSGVPSDLIALMTNRMQQQETTRPR